MAKKPGRSASAPAKKQPRADGTCTLVRYSPKLGREICDRLAQGERWAKICNTGHMPSYTTFYQWLRRYPELKEYRAQAREMAADLYADQVLDVAEAATPATASADRVRIGALQWKAATAAPHLYGGKAEARAEPRKIIVEVRKFEKVTGPDGRTYLREIPKLNEAANDG